MSGDKPKYKNQPFTEDDIQDVRIIIKANDKHYALVPDEHIADRKECSAVRKLALKQALTCHNIVTKSLEEAGKELRVEDKN